MIKSRPNPTFSRFTSQISSSVQNFVFLKTSRISTISKLRYKLVKIRLFLRFSFTLFSYFVGKIISTFPNFHSTEQHDFLLWNLYVDWIVCRKRVRISSRQKHSPHRKTNPSMRKRSPDGAGHKGCRTSWYGWKFVSRYPLFCWGEMAAKFENGILYGQPP